MMGWNSDWVTHCQYLAYHNRLLLAYSKRWIRRSDIDHRARIIPSQTNFHEQATVFAVPQLLCMHMIPLSECRCSSRVDRTLLDSSVQQPRRLPTEFQTQVPRQESSWHRFSVLLPIPSRVTFIQPSASSTLRSLQRITK